MPFDSKIDSKNVAIIYLWAEVTGYVMGALQELSQLTTQNIHVVYWDQKHINSTKYSAESTEKIIFYPRSQVNEEDIYQLLVSRRPSIIVVSGWMDQGYIRACKRYKNFSPSVKVVAGIDDQWTGSLRQRVGSIYYQFFYRKLFDFLWVSGQPQFSYAQRFGYGINNILANGYSADNIIFNSKANLEKRFVFVGRFVKFKAIDLLVDAYCRLPLETQAQWPLVLIGDGDQRDLIYSKSNKNIQILPFLSPDDLKRELAKGGVACLPSFKDQWGVVIHEYSLMGMPILASNGCGAATEFLISGFNGFMFKKGSTDSLHEQLLRFTKLTSTELESFSDNSMKLSKKITREFSAHSLLSVLYI